MNRKRLVVYCPDCAKREFEINETQGRVWNDERYELGRAWLPREASPPEVAKDR
jgi:hypothetical protein